MTTKTLYNDKDSLASNNLYFIFRSVSRSYLSITIKFSAMKKIFSVAIIAKELL